MKLFRIHIASLLLLLGCEEPTNWNIKSVENDLIVVEGLITNERVNHLVRITRPVYDLNDDPEAVAGAVVAVQAGNDVAYFREFPEGSGYYYSDTVQAVVGKRYVLYINVNDKEYFAEAEMVPVTPLKPLQYRAYNAENNEYEIIFQDSSEPSTKEYWIGWSHLPGYEDLPVDSTVIRTFHYSLSSVDVNQSFSPEKEKVLFPAGSAVIRKKYSLSEAHQAFLRTFLSETEWRGSVFDVQKGNVLTNLSDGAVGFFAVSTVVSDTTLIVP